MSELHQSLLTLSTQISKRSILSAIYLAGLTGLMLITPDYNSVLKGNSMTLFGLLILLAIPVAHGSYEIIMPLNRKLSIPKVIKGFKDVVGEKIKIEHIDYDYLRSWKHDFLDKPTSERLKDELEKELTLRQQLTYLFAATVIGVFIVIAIGITKENVMNTIWLGLGISAFMFLVSLLGHFNRSYALGRTYGHAYLSWVSKGEHNQAMEKNAE